MCGIKINIKWLVTTNPETCTLILSLPRLGAGLIYPWIQVEGSEDSGGTYGFGILHA